MDNDEMKRPEDEEIESEEEPVDENEAGSDGENEISEGSSNTLSFNREGTQSADAMFGEEAARSGIIPGLIERDITTEVRTAFLDYAMSVIVARAIPDVRDGFKPVQRRIIFGMNESGM